MSAVTIDELKKQVAEHEARLADVMGEGGSYRRLQVQLDEQLQLHKDKDTAHAAEINAHDEQHAAELKSQQEQFTKAAAESHAAHQAEMVTQQNNLRNECAAALTARDQQHADAVAKLKAEVLVPAMRDLQARQAADLKAKHDADLAKLMG